MREDYSGKFYFLEERRLSTPRGRVDSKQTTMRRSDCDALVERDRVLCAAVSWFNGNVPISDSSRPSRGEGGAVWRPKVGVEVGPAFDWGGVDWKIRIGNLVTLSPIFNAWVFNTSSQMIIFTRVGSWLVWCQSSFKHIHWAHYMHKREAMS